MEVFHFLLLHVVNPILSQYRQGFLHKRQKYSRFILNVFISNCRIQKRQKLNNFKSQKWMRGSYSHNYSYFFFKKVWSVSFNKSEMQRDEKMKQKYCFVTDTKSISVKKKKCNHYASLLSNRILLSLFYAPQSTSFWHYMKKKCGSNSWWFWLLPADAYVGLLELIISSKTLQISH